MNWFSTFLKSSLGKKMIMGITGLFLISFLLVHCATNATIFYNDHGVTFNAAAHFMGTNPIIRTMEIVLFAGLILHIVQGLSLWASNRGKRPVKYKVNPGNKTSKWYSRSMGLLGTLILIFLILHLIHFFIPSRFQGQHDLFSVMLNIFSEAWVVILYCLALISLAYHLIHGFRSAFQTFGLNNKKYTGILHAIGVAYSVIICLVFALMPLSIYFQVLQ